MFKHELVTTDSESELDKVKFGLRRVQFESIVNFMNGSKFSIINLNTGACSHSKTKFKLKHFAT